MTIRTVDVQSGEVSFSDAETQAMPPLDTLKTDALFSVDQEHAAQLRHLTGDATVEERDTWPVKAAAAEAYLAGTASAGQSAMIEAEASGDGTDPQVLAQSITTKATSFLALVGKAGELRRKARKAVGEAATLEALDAAMQAIEAEAKAAADALAGG